MIQSFPLSMYVERAKTFAPKGRVARQVVYTTLFGKSDSLKQPLVGQPDWDLVCVTDREDHDFGDWTPLIIPSLYRDPRRTARIFKIMPWLLFGDADRSIFIDASIRLTGAVSAFRERHCAGAALACFAHPERGCAYLEADACLAQGKDVASTIEAQMRAYHREGYPRHAGLIASAVLVREHGSEHVRALMERWLDEVERHSSRDQLSFNFAVWKLGVSYKVIEMNIFDNPYFEVLPHAHFQRFDVAGIDVASLREKINYRLMASKRQLRLYERRLRRLVAGVSARKSDDR